MAQCRPQFFSLGAGEGFQGGLILLTIPDLVISAARTLRPDIEDDAVQNDPPQSPVDLDNTLVAQKFPEVAAHGPEVGGFWGSEIDQQQAGFLREYGRMAGRKVHFRVSHFGAYILDRKPIVLENNARAIDSTG